MLRTRNRHVFNYIDPLSEQLKLTVLTAMTNFNYGLCSWGFHSDDLFALQKKAVRVVANRPYIAHTDPIFNKYTLIKIHDLYKLQLYKLFYRLCNNLLPLYFNSFFPTVNRTNYNLRNESINCQGLGEHSMFNQLKINCICYCVLLYTNTLNLQILPPCMLLLLFASSSDFFPLVNPVVPGLGRRTPRSCLLASSTV